MGCMGSKPMDFKPRQYMYGDFLENGLVYREYAPAPGLADLVACYWELFAPGTIPPTWHRVVPDGCVDLLVDLQEERLIVTGPMVRSMGFYLHGGVRTLGIRIMPRAVRLVFPEPHVFQGTTGAVEDVLESSDVLRTALRDRGGSGGVIELFSGWSGVQERPGKEDRGSGITLKTELDALMTEILLKGVPRVDDRAGRIIGHILGNPTALRVSDVADYHGISEKQVGRYVRSATGMGTKSFLQVVRFQGLLAELDRQKRRGQSAPGVETALELGYYDQSHMVNDLRRFLSPPYPG